jgi:GNAT superfamily N-acetyltransferase
VVEIAAVDVPDLGRVIRIHNTVRPDDPSTVESFVDWKRQADDMVWLLATEGGEDLAAAVGLVGWHSPPQTSRVHAWTLPEARGRGAGTRLYEELARWSASRRCSAMDTEVDQRDGESLAWAERRGFREVGRDSSLVLDLEGVEAPAVEAPAGIEIVTWAERPGIDRELYEVYSEAEPDIPGEENNELPPFVQWLSSDMHGLSDRPEAVFVAMAGDEVVGYAKLAFPQEGTRVFHDLTGVKRAWRRRGIASALKRAQIRWAKENGFTELVTSNDERNEPILRLNRRHGYRVEPGSIVLRRDL